MVKKELSSHFPYIVIVCLVAIVAVVVLVLNMNRSADTVGVVDEEGNFVGEVFRIGDNVALKKGNLEKKVQELPPIGLKVQECPIGLKDYGITAYTDINTDINYFPNGTEDMAARFQVNDVEFGLTRPAGFREVLNTGEMITLQNVLFQRKAGGLRGLEFTFERACRKGYTIRSFDADEDAMMVQGGWNFWMDGEEFNLRAGESHVLQDGTKVILRHSLKQLLSDSLGRSSVRWGVSFELICQG